jgi:hypothetical protein
MAARLLSVGLVVAVALWWSALLFAKPVVEPQPDCDVICFKTEPITPPKPRFIVDYGWDCPVAFCTPLDPQGDPL